MECALDVDPATASVRCQGYLLAVSLQEGNKDYVASQYWSDWRELTNPSVDRWQVRRMSAFKVVSAQEGQ